MSFPTLPSSGSTSWYSWATAIHAAANPSAVINVMHPTYGAVGDGTTDDTAALQAAFTAGSSTGLPVFLPPGTYLVGGRTGAFNSIFTFSSNLRVYGAGDVSTIKVKNGQYSLGDYMVFAPSTDTTTDHVLFERFRMDGNGANNLQVSGDLTRRAYCFHVPQGTDVTIQNVMMENTPGPNCIVFGNNTSPAKVKSARILYCRFHQSGGAITGNHAQPDHSSIYTQADDCMIFANRFYNDAPVDPNDPAPAARVVTAMEVHGSNTKVIGNYILNYSAGGNAAATVLDSISNVWAYNEFYNITNLGINLWAWTGFHNSNLQIVGNTFHFYQAFTSEVSGIFQDTSSASTTYQMEKLLIADNQFYFDSGTAQALINHGIRISAVDGCIIRGNKIRNWQGDGINFEPHATLNLPITHVDIFDNVIEDIGWSTFGARLWTIHINGNVASRTIAHFRIGRNKFIKISATAMQGMKFEGTSAPTDILVMPDNMNFGITTGSQQVSGSPSDAKGMYVDDSGNLKFRGFSSTVTTLGTA